ncbi:MAG: iron-sulfur cluster-binding protein [Neisseriaceae bacterium]|nr:iron-sulfur cluster-binding protein [Neisseriaceae bacterium]
MSRPHVPIYQDSRHFKSNVEVALNDGKLRHSIRSAMDDLQRKRQLSFPDDAELQALRTLGEQARQYALDNLPDLLCQLEAKLQANGVTVHWAETKDEACHIIHAIMAKHGGQLMLKGKSMVSEEIELNHYLEAQGIQALETDMGEYIVQMANEKPTHIVCPAIHKTKQDIAQLFHEELPDTPYTEDVDELIHIGRTSLREQFIHADVGLSGVNFAVAETGTLCLVENEGNGRMCTTVPPIHIAITGIEKVVAKLSDVVPLYSLLPRSALGQNITTYFNMISRPRQPGEKDGPKEVHLVLLDNGRTQAYHDEQLRQTLQCIRCGACMNHCPVYARIGGAAYGTTYPGPIGEIISPHLLGLADTQHLPTASSLCGACVEVCPVRIPITDLLIRLRTEAQRPAADSVHAPLKGQGAAHTRKEAWAWRAFGGLFSGKKTYRALGFVSTRLRGLTPKQQLGWTLNHTPLKPAAKTLHQLIKEHQQAQK